MKTLLVSAIIFCAYWIVSINDENVKLKETLAAETWCEVKYEQSKGWHQCRIIGKDEFNRQVATIGY